MADVEALGFAGVLTLGMGAMVYSTVSAHSFGRSMDHIENTEEMEVRLIQRYADRESPKDLNELYRRMEGLYTRRHERAKQMRWLLRRDRELVDSFYEGRVDGLENYRRMDPAEAHARLMTIQSGDEKDRPFFPWASVKEEPVKA